MRQRAGRNACTATGHRARRESRRRWLRREACTAPAGSTQRPRTSAARRRSARSSARRWGSSDPPTPRGRPAAARGRSDTAEGWRGPQTAAAAPRATGRRSMEALTASLARPSAAPLGTHCRRSYRGGEESGARASVARRREGNGRRRERADTSAMRGSRSHQRRRTLTHLNATRPGQAARATLAASFGSSRSRRLHFPSVVARRPCALSASACDVLA